MANKCDLESGMEEVRRLAAGRSLNPCLRVDLDTRSRVQVTDGVEAAACSAFDYVADRWKKYEPTVRRLIGVGFPWSFGRNVPTEIATRIASWRKMFLLQISKREALSLEIFDFLVRLNGRFKSPSEEREWNVIEAWCRRLGDCSERAKIAFYIFDAVGFETRPIIGFLPNGVRHSAVKVKVGERWLIMDAAQNIAGAEYPHVELSLREFWAHHVADQARDSYYDDKYDDAVCRARTSLLLDPWDSFAQRVLEESLRMTAHFRNNSRGH